MGLNSWDFKESDIDVVYSGLDWLALSTPKMLCTSILEQLADLRTRSAEKDVELFLDIALEVPDQPGELRPRVMRFAYIPGGTKSGFSYRLQSEDLEITARAFPAKIGSMPNVLFRARNEFLHRMDWTLAYALIEMLAAEILEDHGPSDELQITRVDLFLDCQGFDLDRFSCRQYMRPPSRTTSAEFRTGQRSTGFTVTPQGGKISDPYEQQTGFRVGKGGGIKLRVYDKTEEIAMNSFKMWFHDIWAQAPSFNPLASVTRVEFSVLREKLKSFRGDELPDGISTISDLIRVYSSLWRYLTGEATVIRGRKRRGWVTARIPGTDRNPARWKEHPWWLAVRHHAVDEEPLHRVETVPLREAEAYRPQSEGVLAAMAARYAAIDGGSPEEFFEVLKMREEYSDRMPKAFAVLVKALGGNELEGLSKERLEKALEIFLAMDGVSIDWKKIEARSA